MCDACRQRFLFVKNRLEELAWKYGPLLEPEPEAVALLPSWGPDGSLAARCMTEEALRELLSLHRHMLTLERQRQERAAPPPEPQGADW